MAQRMWQKAGFLFFLSLIILPLQSGCLVARGTLYLEKERVDTYLAKEQRPPEVKGDKQKEVEAAVEKSRLLLRQVPDGNRIMGGFCTQKYVLDKIQEIIDNAPKCRDKLQIYQSQSNVNGIVFWSLLGATVGAGIAMGLGVALPQGPNSGSLRVGLGLGFGIPMVLLAITNTTVPFSEWQDEARVKMNRIDNYMWTLRKRLQIEVCNAPSEDLALDRMDAITIDFKMMCNAPDADDGTYRIPTNTK
jgi:hypothetical protein